MKCHIRNRSCYVPEEYAKLIQQSSSLERFNVKMPISDDTLEFKPWSTAFYEKIYISVETSGNSSPRSQKISFTTQQFLCFEYSNMKPGIITAKPFTGSLFSQQSCLKNPSHIRGILKATNQESTQKKVPNNNDTSNSSSSNNKNILIKHPSMALAGPGPFSVSWNNGQLLKMILTE